jgi:hypothetical protein
MQLPKISLEINNYFMIKVLKTTPLFIMISEEVLEIVKF